MLFLAKRIRSIQKISGLPKSAIDSYKEYSPAYKFLLLVLITGILSMRFVFAGEPVIELESPSENATITTDQVYVKGKVRPKGTQITVNDAAVFLNGDGSFTYVMPAKTGTNTIRVKAKKFSGTSEVVRLIERKEDETLAKAKEEASKADKPIESFESLKNRRDESQVSGAKVSDGNSGVVITKQQLVSNLNPLRITGEVANQTEGEVSDVKLTAIFYNPENEVVDIRANYISPPNYKLAIGQALPFEIQTTIAPTDFSTYKFEVAWQ